MFPIYSFTGLIEHPFWTLRCHRSMGWQSSPRSVRKEKENSLPYSLISLDLTNESLFTFFFDNEQTSGRHSLIFVVRELNDSSFNATLTNERVMFSANYELRLYTSACFYFDEQIQKWKSDGLKVGPLTNHFQTQCLSTHLTKFTSEFSILPEPSNWHQTFRNEDLLNNRTSPSTVASHRCPDRLFE